MNYVLITVLIYFCFYLVVSLMTFDNDYFICLLKVKQKSIILKTCKVDKSLLKEGVLQNIQLMSIILEPSHNDELLAKIIFHFMRQVVSEIDGIIYQAYNLTY